MDRLLRGPRRVVVVNLLAACALLAAATLAAPVVGTVVALVAVVLVAYVQRRSFFRPGPGRPGAWAIARTALLGTALVGVVRDGMDGWDVLTALVVALLVLLTALEGRLGGIWSGATRPVANLPGVDPARPYTTAVGALQVAHLAALTLCLLVPLVPVVALLAAALAAGILVVSGLWSLQARRDRAPFAAAVTTALERHAAPVMVYLSGPGGTEYQLGVWTSELERLADEGTGVVVVVRERSLAQRVAALTSLPVVSAPSLAELEALQVPAFRVALYVNNGAKNGHNVRYRDLTHVQLLHGDSDKPSSYNPVTAMFDRIFVAGQAGIDRYASHGVHIPDEKFVIVGRPQVADIRHADAGAPLHTVFYGPTWGGFNQDNSFGSLAWGEQIVEGLLARGYRVIFRPHPYSLRQPDEAAHVEAIHALLDADRRRSGREHLFGEAASATMSLVDCFNASDALVSDVSSVPADYLYSGKPFVITQVDDTPVDEFLDEFPLGRAAYLARLAEPGSLDAALDGLADDRLAAERDRTRRYYLGDIPEETYARTFRDAVRATVADAGPPPLHHAHAAGAEDEEAAELAADAADDDE